MFEKSIMKIKICESWIREQVEKFGWSKKVPKFWKMLNCSWTNWKEKMDYCVKQMSSRFYSKTSKRIFKNFAKPLSILMSSLLNSFTKFVWVFFHFRLWVKIFLCLVEKLGNALYNASHHRAPPFRRYCMSSPPLAWKQFSRNEIG